MELAELIEKKEGAWTADQLAELLECSPKMLYKLVRQGRLPAVKIGTLIRFCPKATAAWVRQRSTAPARR